MSDFDEQVREAARKAVHDLGPVRFDVPDHDSGETVIRRLVGLLSRRIDPEFDDPRVDVLADAIESAYRAGRAKSEEEMSARDLLARLDGMRATAGDLS